MQVVTLFHEIFEDLSTSGKVDISCFRVAALHCAADCIDSHIGGAVRVIEMQGNL